MKLLAPLAACLLLLAACAAAPKVPPGEALGEPIEPRPVLRLSEVAADPAAHRDKTLLVEATAIAVCRKKGCWMQVEDGGRRAMVRWEAGCGGRYAFPQDVTGKRVLIQGSYYAKSITEEDAEHLEEEGGPGVTIDRETSEMNASAILVRYSGIADTTSAR